MTTQLSVYLAGPMSGYAENNFPAFAEAAAQLRAAGYHVVSPAEAHPDSEYPYSLWTWQQFLKADLQLMLQQDMVALLPGWYISRGASLERDTAVAVKMETYPLADLLVPAVIERLLGASVRAA